MMKKLQMLLVLALALAGFAAAVLLGLAALTGPLSFQYRGSPAVGIFRAAALVTGLLAGAALFAAALAVEIPLALTPVKFGGRMLNALPLFGLGLLLAGALFAVTGIGSGLFASAWLAVSALVAAATLVFAALRSLPEGRALKTALGGLSAASVLSLAGVLALAALTILVLTSPPGSGGRGLGEGAFPGRFEGGREGGFGGPNILRPALIAGTLLLAAAAAGLGVVTLRARRASAALPLSAAAPASFSPQAAGQALIALASVAAIFMIAIQLVPVDRTNPPVQTPLKWDSPATQDLATRACLDCHSNETRWPWYATFAPGSWLTMAHVAEGRQRLNFSQLDLNRASRMSEEIAQQIQRGTMPPADYLLIHPDARLTDAQKQQLIQGLQNTLGQ